MCFLLLLLSFEMTTWYIVKPASMEALITVLHESASPGFMNLWMKGLGLTLYVGSLQHAIAKSGGFWLSATFLEGFLMGVNAWNGIYCETTHN